MIHCIQMLSIMEPTSSLNSRTAEQPVLYPLNGVLEAEIRPLRFGTKLESYSFVQVPVIHDILLFRKTCRVMCCYKEVDDFGRLHSITPQALVLSQNSA